MRRLASRVNENQQGITGLETAIILIAFVIVASVFAYVVLSAGLFSAQKAKEAVHAGLEETRSTMELKGNVLARMVDSVVTEVYFTVGTPAAGDPIDFTPPSDNTTDNTTSNLVVISFADTYQHFPSVNWTMQKLTTTNQDNLLDKNELFQVTVDLSAVSANVTDAWKLGAYHTFTLEVKPPVGAVLTIERTVPARVSQLVNLY